MDDKAENEIETTTRHPGFKVPLSHEKRQGNMKWKKLLCRCVRG